MLIFGILPFALWIYGPKWLHPYLLVVGVVTVIVLGVLLYRYIEDDRRSLAELPSRSDHRWPSGWDVAGYHRVLLTFLKIDDWRILSARAVDPDRLLLFLQRDRHHLPVLLIRPGLEPAAADLDLLRAIQRDDGLWEAALFRGLPGRAAITTEQDGARVLELDYEALPFLAEHLEGGPEEERRAAALHARLVAEARRNRAAPADTAEANSPSG